MLNTARAYFIRESGGTFLGETTFRTHESSANIDTTNESSK